MGPNALDTFELYRYSEDLDGRDREAVELHYAASRIRTESINKKYFSPPASRRDGGRVG